MAITHASNPVLLVTVLCVLSSSHQKGEESTLGRDVSCWGKSWNHFQPYHFQDFWLNYIPTPTWAPLKLQWNVHCTFFLVWKCCCTLLSLWGKQTDWCFSSRLSSIIRYCSWFDWEKMLHVFRQLLILALLCAGTMRASEKFNYLECFLWRMAKVFLENVKKPTWSLYYVVQVYHEFFWWV